MKIIQGMKNHFKKTAVISGTAVVTVASACLPAFAAEGTFDVSQYTSAFQSCVTNFISIMAALAPIGLSVFIAKYCWIEGSKFFSRLSKAK